MYLSGRFIIDGSPQQDALPRSSGRRFSGGSVLASPRSEPKQATERPKQTTERPKQTEAELKAELPHSGARRVSGAFMALPRAASKQTTERPTSVQAPRASRRASTGTNAAMGDGRPRSRAGLQTPDSTPRDAPFMPKTMPNLPDAFRMIAADIMQPTSSGSATGQDQLPEDFRTVRSARAPGPDPLHDAFRKFALTTLQPTPIASSTGQEPCKTFPEDKPEPTTTSSDSCPQTHGAAEMGTGNGTNTPRSPALDSKEILDAPAGVTSPPTGRSASSYVRRRKTWSGRGWTTTFGDNVGSPPWTLEPTVGSVPQTHGDCTTAPENNVGSLPQAHSPAEETHDENALVSPRTSYCMGSLELYDPIAGVSTPRHTRRYSTEALCMRRRQSDRTPKTLEEIAERTSESWQEREKNKRRMSDAMEKIVLAQRLVRRASDTELSGNGERTLQKVVELVRKAHCALGDAVNPEQIIEQLPGEGIIADLLRGKKPPSCIMGA